MTPDQEQQLNELIAWKANLEKSQSIPLNIDQSFRGRFINPLAIPTVSTKSATSENRAVDEGGALQYSVLTAPDGFLQIKIETTTYYIPIYT